MLLSINILCVSQNLKKIINLTSNINKENTVYHTTTQYCSDAPPPPRAMIHVHVPILRSGLQTCFHVAEDKLKLNVNYQLMI